MKKLFEETRKAFDETEIVPLSKKVVRLKKLSGYVERLEGMGNIGKAAEIIEQIAKDEGDVFTNKHKIDGDLSVTHSVVRVPAKISPEEWKRQSQKQTPE
jgi:hypothetical protein